MSSILKISDTISLIAITLTDADVLLDLMRKIYTPPYRHLWEDNGQWYVEKTFCKASLEKEMAELNASYYFVTHYKEIIGVLRFIHDVTFIDFKNLKSTKLHRIYLDPTTHGKGIGKLLMDWTATEAIKNDSQLLWLEAMDTQEQALVFYKKLGYQISSDFRLTFELMQTHLRGMLRMYLDL